MMSRLALRALALMACLVVAACSVAGQQPMPATLNDAACDVSAALLFDGEAANRSISEQVDLGPRMPGSNASLALRTIMLEAAEANGWSAETQVHERHGMNLSNVILTLNGSAAAPRTAVVLSAHYDSRNIADQDLNASNRSLPVPGANDGASGTAVLLQFISIAPQLNLEHDLVLFFNDAEDQNENYTEGAEAWADNLTNADVQRIESFLLLDMVGDADLHLHDIEPGNQTLKQRLLALGAALGMVADQVDCDGDLGQDIMRYNVTTAVIDDHVHPHALGIPSVNLMDPVYGEPKSGTFGSYWHTMEDTPDKVSAESLERVGRLVEVALRTGALLNVDPQEQPESNDPDPTPTDTETSSAPPRNSGLLALGLVGLFLILGLIGTAEWYLKRH